MGKGGEREGGGGCEGGEEVGGEEGSEEGRERVGVWVWM